MSIRESNSKPSPNQEVEKEGGRPRMPSRGELLANYSELMRHYSGLIWRLRIAGAALPTAVAGLSVAFTKAGKHMYGWALFFPFIFLAIAFAIWDLHIARHWSSLYEAQREDFGDVSAWRYFENKQGWNIAVRFALSFVLFSVAAANIYILLSTQDD